jgi:hypothetical protein
VGEQLDRRSFLAAGLTAGAALLAGGCGGGGARARRVTKTSRRSGGVTRRAPPRRLADAIRGHVFERGAPGYAASAQVYNQRFDGVQPDAVARPLDAADVRAAVRWALSQGVGLRARSGGHSYAGYSTLERGTVLDLRRLNRIEVDRSTGTATIGPGAQLVDVYATLAGHGVTLPGGSCPSVGIAGVTLGGGMGLAGRAFGLTADHLVGAQIVSAAGELQALDAAHDPDLLWALRGGGGGNFGIVTEFTFRLHALPPGASWFIVSWPWTAAAQALSSWLAWAPGSDQRITSIFRLQGGGGSTSVDAIGQYLGSPADLSALLAPLQQVPGTSVASGYQDYLGLQLRWAGCLEQSLASCHTVGTAPGGTLPRAAFDAKSDYLDRPLTDAVAGGLVRAVEARLEAPGSGAILFDSYGGAINRVDPSATAFVHRDMLCAMQYLSYDADYGWLGQTWRQMRPHVSGQAYQNYIDASLPGWREAYYGANYPRLAAIRQEVDPHRFFGFPQGI